MNDKFLSLLGMARKSGKLCPGHDAAVSSVVKNQAKLCIVSQEGSERLRKEMKHCCSYDGKNIPLIIVSYTVTELSQAIGTKAAVLTVTDEGFGKALEKRYDEISRRAEN